MSSNIHSVDPWASLVQFVQHVIPSAETLSKQALLRRVFQECVQKQPSEEFVAGLKERIFPLTCEREGEFESCHEIIQNIAKAVWKAETKDFLEHPKWPSQEERKSSFVRWMLDRVKEGDVSYEAALVKAVFDQKDPLECLKVLIDEDKLMDFCLTHLEEILGLFSAEESKDAFLELLIASDQPLNLSEQELECFKPYLSKVLQLSGKERGQKIPLLKKRDPEFDRYFSKSSQASSPTKTSPGKKNDFLPSLSEEIKEEDSALLGILCRIVAGTCPEKEIKINDLLSSKMPSLYKEMKVGNHTEKLFASSLERLVSEGLKICPPLLFAEMALGRKLAVRKESSTTELGAIQHFWHVFTEYHDKESLVQLLKIFLPLIDNEAYIDFYDSLQKTVKNQRWQGEHLWFLAVLPAAWSYQDPSKGTFVQQVFSILHENRELFRGNHKYLLPLFIRGQIVLHQASLSDDVKVRLLSLMIDPAWTHTKEEGVISARAQALRECLCLLLILNSRNKLASLSENITLEQLQALGQSSLSENPLFQLQGMSQEEISARYSSLVAKMRNASSLEMYGAWICKSCGSGSIEFSTLKTLLQLLLSDETFTAFTEARYQQENNPHLKEVHRRNQGVLQKWADRDQGITRSEGNQEYRVINTDDWQDLFLSGTEVSGSCQSAILPKSENKCLLAYVLDGKNRMIAVKDPSTGKIVARAFFRLLLQGDGAVCLFVDKIYPMGAKESMKQWIYAYAKTEAERIQLPVFIKREESSYQEAEKKTLSTAFSLESNCPYDYLDIGGEGVKEKGMFTLSGLEPLPG